MPRKLADYNDAEDPELSEVVRSLAHRVENIENTLNHPKDGVGVRIVRLETKMGIIAYVAGATFAAVVLAIITILLRP